MKHILAELNETLGARGSLIVSKDGLLIAADVRPEVQKAFNAWVDAASSTSVWESGCHSWYTTAAGRNTNNWPDHTFHLRSLAAQLAGGVHVDLAGQEIQRLLKEESELEGADFAPEFLYEKLKAHLAISGPTTLQVAKASPQGRSAPAPR